MNRVWQHFKTITHHRFLVMKGCFRAGLFWQGLTHDLSKYSFTEFWTGVKYFQGNRSPNAAEREDRGYSTAWMHHKGRNRHHFEYWTDIDRKSGKYQPLEMPRKYLAEMVIDRISACKVYKGADYRDGSALEYLEASRDGRDLHPETLRQLRLILTMLRDHGEAETYRFLRTVVLKGEPF